MKSVLTFALMGLLAAAPALRADTLPPEDQYFNIYSLIVKGDRLVEKGRTDAARTNYLEATAELKRFQEDFPLWNAKVVKYRLSYLETKLATPETAAPANTGKPVALRMKWQVGKRYDQQMDMAVNTDIAVPGQGDPMHQKMTMGEGYAISVLKEREGGGQELELKMTGISMNMEMGGKSLMAFDSKNPPGDAGANPLAGVMQKLADMHFKVMTDANGKVENIEGFREFLDSMGGSDATGGADAIKGMISEDSLKQMISTQGLPDHPVKIGDTWPVKTEISLPTLGTMVMDMTFTFTGWEQRADHKCAVLSFSGRVYTKPGEDGKPTGMVSLDDGKTSGKVFFDPVLGMPVETSTIQNFTMNVSVQGQSMSTKITQDMSTKLAGMTDIPQ